MDACGTDRKNVELVKLDQVLGKLDELHEDLQQIKVCLSGLEGAVNVLTRTRESAGPDN